MKVLELMERSGTRDTNLCLAWIKDAIHTIESAQNKPLNLRVKKINLVKDTRDYQLPSDLISIRHISVLDTESDNKYKMIKRMVGKPITTEDTNP